MSLNNNQLAGKTRLINAFESFKDSINYNLNCVKIATVVSFNPENMTVCCRVNNKRVVGLKKDGNQILQDYPLIFAKAHFFGWGNIGAVYPIFEGMEGVLLFNDREIESWFINGGINKLAYNRCHDLSDAIFICGLHSMPNVPLLPYIEACLHIYYGESDIQIKNDSITRNTETDTTNCTNQYINCEENQETECKKDQKIKCDNQKVECTKEIDVKSQTMKLQTELTFTGNKTQIGNNTINGQTTSAGLADTTAATGSFASADQKVIIVVNGIVKEIRG